MCVCGGGGGGGGVGWSGKCPRPITLKLLIKFDGVVDNHKLINLV